MAGEFASSTQQHDDPPRRAAMPYTQPNERTMMSPTDRAAFKLADAYDARATQYRSTAAREYHPIRREQLRNSADVLNTRARQLRDELWASAR